MERSQHRGGVAHHCLPPLHRLGGLLSSNNTGAVDYFDRCLVSLVRAPARIRGRMVELRSSGRSNCRIANL